MDEPLAVTLLVARALEAVGTGYFIGGSLASGLYGLGRATMDGGPRTGRLCGSCSCLSWAGWSTCTNGEQT